MESIFVAVWDPGVRLWFIGGGIISFIAGFFAMSEGRIFKRAPGLLFLNTLFVAGLVVLGLIWVRASFLTSAVAFILYWICLRLGGRLMMSLIGGSR